MKKIYYLANCSTCKRIMAEVGTEGFELQDIKTEKIKTKQLEAMKKMAGSYEALFTRRSMKYRSMGLAEKELTEKDYKSLILEEYTFLKRPVFIVEEEIFIGNAKKTVEAIKKAVV